MMDMQCEKIKYSQSHSHKHRMLFISLLMNVPTVFLTQTVHTSSAQPGLTIAEQNLGGAETAESLTLFPLQS